ncbi:cyclic nucleotide-gated channel beta-3-like [Brevipalpus obovatus]|uniref:cyclic nucleotide-gated channel beta-3-like n=1 Tax=Brevipalpus obovatus TaxID=246614 RepID=UPI003D9FAE64
MFKQVVLSATRPKTPSVYATPPPSSSCEMSHNIDEMDVSSSRRYSTHYFGRSLSWDAMESESQDTYHQAMRRRSRSAKVKAFRSANHGEVTIDSSGDEWRARDSSPCSNILKSSENETEILTNLRNLPASTFPADSHPFSTSYSPIETSSASVVHRIHDLIRSFRQRASTIKTRISKPIGIPYESPTHIVGGPRGKPGIINQSPLSVGSSPSQSSSSSSSCPSLLPEWLEKYGSDENSFDSSRTCWEQLKSRLSKHEIGVFDFQSYFFIAWLMIVTIAYLYNCWIIFLRSSFPYQTQSNLKTFFILDYASDFIFLLDVLFFKSRVTFVEKGQVIRDVRRCRQHYHESSMFRFDCLALMPLDIFYLLIGPKSILRLPRLLKVQTFWQFFDRVDALAKWPYFFRILRTLTYMMFLIHLNACAFYYISYLEGFDANEWVYDNKGNAYIRCLYFSIRTATSISGKMPKPTNSYEYMFMTFSWLLGIFVFAFLIGQIRDIVATASQNKAHYRQILDSILRYMDNLNLPDDTKCRVRQWITHTWEQQKLFNENKIFYTLPMKIRTDLAMDIHYKMLSQVDLFKECDKNVIRDIAVKLKPILFLPGNYICCKGEVGYEMYIVSKGKVNILREDRIGNESRICELGPGGVFGEIAVLGIPGLSRRTASVRSVGYSNLFMLSKSDLWDTLRNYPETQKKLHNKAKQVIQERALRDRHLTPESSIDVDCIIKEPDYGKAGTPKLLKMVMQMLPPESACSQMLKRTRSFDVPSTSASEGFNRARKRPCYMPSVRIRSTTESFSDFEELAECDEGAFGQDYSLEDIDNESEWDEELREDEC